MKKNLAKFSKIDRRRILDIKKHILNNDLKGLDVKRLAGRDDGFRVRKGDFRIIYLVRHGRIHFVAIERRSKSTYK